jgi:hypothetical protein
MNELNDSFAQKKLLLGSQEFLGNLEEICIATHDLDKCMVGLAKLGIGPWKVFTFDPTTVSEQTYNGKLAEWGLKVAFAQFGSMVLEIMQPLWGPNIIADFLKKNGEGIHHIAFDLNHIPWDERIRKFEERGFGVSQSGIWAGKCKFAFFDTDAHMATCFESILFYDNWEEPIPDYLYIGGQSD